MLFHSKLFVLTAENRLKWAFFAAEVKYVWSRSPYVDFITRNLIYPLMLQPQRKLLFHWIFSWFHNHRFSENFISSLKALITKRLKVLTEINAHHVSWNFWVQLGVRTSQIQKLECWLKCKQIWVCNSISR